jgi:DNA-binding beta-propeller fold protein YncE
MMRPHLIRILVSLALALMTLVVGQTPLHAQITIQLTDTPGQWFSPAVTTVAPGTSVTFHTTTFGGTFTSAIFPCTPGSISAGTCGLSNSSSFPPGFPFDQPDPISGSVSVDFTVPGIYVFADKVHPYALGVLVVTDAGHPLTAKQQALLSFVAQNQLFLNETNWHRYSPGQLTPPSAPGVGEVWIDTQFEAVPHQNTSGTVTAVNASTFGIRMKVNGTSLCADSDCHGIWNNPHNNWTTDNEGDIYVTHWFDHVISKINRQTGQIEVTGSVGSSPAHVITSPGNGSLWASVMGENVVKRLNPQLQVLNSVQTGATHTHPHGPWFTSDGRLMIVPNALSDTAGILIFDTGTGRLLKEIPVGAEPLAVGITPDDRKAYMSNGFDASLDVLDLTTLAVTKSIDLSDGTPGPNEFPGAFDEISLVHPFRIPIQTPVSPDGKFVVTAALSLLGPGAIDVVNTGTDQVVESFPCEPGCHGANFGAKLGGGYYGYVTSQYTNALNVVDLYPPGGGLPQIAGKVFLGTDGVGGQGVLPIPLAYEGWVERAVAADAPSVNLLTHCQQHPILYVAQPTLCPPGA